YSGKDGHLLWKASGLADGGDRSDRGIRGCQWLDVRDLDGDGRPGIVVIYTTGRDNLGTCWLAVLSSRNGAVRWKKKLGGLHYSGFTASYSSLIRFQQPTMIDLNGDGVLDLVVLSQTEEDNPAISTAVVRDDPATSLGGQSLRALDGRTGRLL